MEPTSLKHLMQTGLISPLSYFFARFLCQQYQRQEDHLLAWSAALVSEQNQRGDVCVNLGDHAEKPFFELATNHGEPAPILPKAPALAVWLAALQGETAVAAPAQIAPLILEGQRLYLARFHAYERQVQDAILTRLTPTTELALANIQQTLQKLFPEQDGATALDDQKLASALALRQSFSVLSGGPGTGKTTTLVKILALLLAQHPTMRIQLAAPTGKAAARMLDSIRARKAELNIPETTRAAIPDHASTLHRLLGYDGQHFRHNKQRPLLVDCLVIDEASMIDLTMMARLFAALPQQARLLLLGDRDQLASVEAGNIMGDITGHGQNIEYSPAQAEHLAQMIQTPVAQLPSKADAPAISDAIALLRTSYRFKEDSGIGQLARLIKQGQGQAALRLIQQSKNSQITWIEAAEHSVASQAMDWALQSYQAYLQCDTIEEALQKFEQVRILCALHNGPYGVTEINRRIAERLRQQSLIPNGEDHHGKPIIVTVNDYEVELYNGDIGLLWRDEHNALRAWFRQSDQKIRNIPVRSLPEHLPAWALTVHKSQGSEFDNVLMVLPPQSDGPLLSRELIYTGITRAKKKLILHGSGPAWIQGCTRRVKRSSGLAEKLGWNV